jgi:hypothetical protein
MMVTPLPEVKIDSNGTIIPPKGVTPNDETLPT